MDGWRMAGSTVTDAAFPLTVELIAALRNLSPPLDEQSSKIRDCVSSQMCSRWYVSREKESGI